jgi:hypothetical protein
MRYLTDYNIRSALNRRKFVEQFLGSGSDGDKPTIRRLVLAFHEEGFRLTYYETYDEGSDTFHDVYEFSSVAPDDDPPEQTFDTLKDALAHAVSVYGASPSRWVNQFVIQDEYADYRRTNSVPE